MAANWNGLIGLAALLLPPLMVWLAGDAIVEVWRRVGDRRAVG